MKDQTEPIRTRGGPRCGAASGKTPKPDGENRTHHPGVHLLAAAARSRSERPVETQDGNQQQQQHLRRRIPSSCDGSDEYRNPTSWTRGPPTPSQTRRCSCQTSPREALPPGGAQTHWIRYRNTRTTKTTAAEVATPGQNRGKARASPRAFASREQEQKKSLARRHAEPPVDAKSVTLKEGASGEVHQNKAFSTETSNR